MKELSINPAWVTAPYHAAFCVWYPGWMLKLSRKRRRHQMRLYFKNVVKKMFPQYSKKNFDNMVWTGVS